MFLEECKYVVKKKEMPKYITDNIEIFSDDSDKEDSDEESIKNLLRRQFVSKRD